MGTPPKPDPIKYCQTCGALMTRKRFGSRLEDMSRFLSRLTCGPVCGSTKTDVTLAAHRWRAQQHRGTVCQECSTTQGLHVHHIDRDPTNNDPGNLVTLCGSCHLKLHWREDRSKRMAAATRARETAVARGVDTRQRSTDGRWSSAG